MHLKPAEWYSLLLVTDACIHVYAVLNSLAKWLPCFHVQGHPSLLNVPAILTFHNVYMILLGLTAVKQIHACWSEAQDWIYLTSLPVSEPYKTCEWEINAIMFLWWCRLVSSYMMKTRRELWKQCLVACFQSSDNQRKKETERRATHIYSVNKDSIPVTFKADAHYK